MTQIGYALVDSKGEVIRGYSKGGNLAVYRSLSGARSARGRWGKDRYKIALVYICALDGDPEDAGLRPEEAYTG